MPTSQERSVIVQTLRAYPWSFMGFLFLCLLVPKLYELSWLFWVGRIGADALSIAEQQEFLSITIEVINEAAAIGVLSLVARQTADRTHVLGALWAGLSVCLVGSGLLSAMLWLSPALCIKAIGTPYALVSATCTFLRLRACGLPFDAAALVFLATLKALGRAKHALAIVVLGTLLNAGLDLWLISDTRFSWRLGITGMAVSFVITKVSVCLLAAAFCRSVLQIRSSDVLRGLAVAWPGFLSAGGWAGMDSLVRNIGYAMLLTVLNALGSQSFAGYGLAMTTIWTGILPVLALTEGTNVLVGSLYGQRRHAEIDRTLVVSLLLVLATMGVLILVGMSNWQGMARFLNPHAQVVSASEQVFHTLALAYVLFALSQILKSLFVGTGRTVNLFVVSVITNGLLVIPYVLFVRWSGKPPRFSTTMSVFGAAMILDFLLTSALAWHVPRSLLQVHHRNLKRRLFLNQTYFQQTIQPDGFH